MIHATNPLPGSGPPNADSLYGAPRADGTRAHEGWDENATPGTPVRAPGQGRTIQAGPWTAAAGLAVTLDLGQGWSFFGCHLLETFVDVGDTVQAGQPIGAVGKTGNAEGPHLHFGFRQHGQPVNPLHVLQPDAGPNIAWLQTRLAAHRYQPGPPDGWYGPRTGGALAHFQADKRLDPTGSADPLTLQALKAAPRGWPRHPANVERWRPLVQRHWAGTGEPVDYILQVGYGESEGDPNATNPTSGAAGILQHLPGYWAARSAAAGWPGASPYQPAANIAVAAWLWRQQGWPAWEATYTRYPRAQWTPAVRWLGDRYGIPT